MLDQKVITFGAWPKVSSKMSYFEDSFLTSNLRGKNLSVLFPSQLIMIPPRIAS